MTPNRELPQITTVLVTTFSIITIGLIGVSSNDLFAQGSGEGEGVGTNGGNGASIQATVKETPFNTRRSSLPPHALSKKEGLSEEQMMVLASSIVALGVITLGSVVWKKYL